MNRLADMYEQTVTEVAKPHDTDALLDERGSKYGTFVGLSEIAQSIKEAMRRAPNWEGLADDQREALELVATKIGRILNGDPYYIDNWDDVIGYTKLVADRLRGVVR